MKTILSIVGVSILLTASAWAAPVGVTLYPGGAVIQEEVQLTPDAQGKVTFQLKPEADPGSVNLTVRGAKVQSQTFDVSEVARSPQYDALEKELDQVKAEMIENQTGILTVDNILSVLLHPPLRLDSPEPLPELTRQLYDIASNYQKTQLQLMDAREKLEVRRDVLQERLNNLAGQNKQTRQVTLQLENPGQNPVTVNYSYSTSGAGWRPMYRLEALPGKGEIVLNLEAELWQNSGENWQQMPISLVTINPNQNTAPPSLGDWVIQARRPVTLRANMEMNTDAMLRQSAVMPAQGMVEAKMAAPQYSEGAAFAAWELGKRDLPAGPRLRLPLDEVSLKADFDYTIRPSRSDYAYLSAKLNSPADKHWPTGRALLLVDGVVTGNDVLALETEKEPRLFFGRDPLVFAAMKQKLQQSGQEGLISKAQTYVWDWDINVTNQHKVPVKVRVEDPLPQSRAEQISVQIVSKPEAVTEDQTLIWNLEVKPGQTSTIQHKVSFSAPTDLNIDQGR